MAKIMICFSAKRRCHHDDYFRVVNAITPAINVKKIRTKLRYIFSRKAIILFDIDLNDMIFAPLFMLRSLWGAKSMAVSVRTEFLIGSTETDSNKALKIKVKQIIFLILKKLSRTRVYSIHKNTPYSSALSKYVYDFIYDPQLWDLQVLKESEQMPPELDGMQKEELKQFVLFAGSVEERTSRSDFLAYLKTNPAYRFLIAGSIQPEDENELRSYPNVTVINRYTSNEELYTLMKYAGCIYCFYTNDRPSGFFGRAMQHQKPVIVRKDKYLHINFSEYPGLLAVDQLEELVLPDLNAELTYSNPYDDYQLFVQILESLK